MPERIVDAKPRPRDRISIRLSGGRFFTVMESVDVALEPGTLLSDQEVDRLSRMDQYLRGRDKATRLIAIRSRTRFEIRKALDGIHVSRPIRDGILCELEEQGLVDDRRFAREFVRARVEVKGFGPHRLRFELARLGVPDAIVEEVLVAETDPAAQRDVAWRLVRKRLGDRVPDRADVRRLADYLRRKGIDYEIINDVSYELLQSARTEESFD